MFRFRVTQVTVQERASPSKAAYPGLAAPVEDTNSLIVRVGDEAVIALDRQAARRVQVTERIIFLEAEAAHNSSISRVEHENFP